MRSILNVIAAVICLCAVARADEPIKLGIMGLDTSHAAPVQLTDAVEEAK